MRAANPLGVTLVTLATLGGLSSSAPLSAGQRPAGTGTDTQAISALNDCIQERFKDINDRFGVSRIVKIGETPHRFSA